MVFRVRTIRFSSRPRFRATRFVLEPHTMLSPAAKNPFDSSRSRKITTPGIARSQERAREKDRVPSHARVVPFRESPRQSYCNCAVHLHCIDYVELTTAKMDNNDTDEFTPRTYQIDLYEVALKQNTIIYLPTGCGKTFIAVMLIKQLSAAVRRPYLEGGKHTVFLVNTVPLVAQQSSYIERMTGLSCGAYSGDIGVDFWKDSEWDKELTAHQALVMTSQILLDALCHGFMYLNRINLLILDECHRAVNDHPMRQIMQMFENCPKEEQPRVLGLTATLLNANVDLHKIQSTIRNLEITLHANIATVDSVSQVKNSYASPKEMFARFKKYVLSDVEVLICKTIDEMADILDLIALKSSLKNIESSKRFRPKAITEKLVNILNDVKDHFLQTGLYGGSKCVLLHMIQLETIKKYNDDADTTYVLEYLISEFAKFRKLLEDEMKNDTEIAKLQNYSSDQVQKLFAVLLDFNKNRSSDHKFCCIIFVKRRFTAKVLYHILKNLSVHHESFKFLQPDYVIGTTNDPYRSSKELLCTSKWNKEVLCRFKNGTSNCLIATDIIDEGIDIPTCTLIIRYNLPMDIRAYIQSKGRARYSASQYTLLLPEGDNNYLKRYEHFKTTEAYLQQLLQGKTQYREQPSDNEIKDALYTYEIEPYASINSSGKKCIINEQSAISIVNTYCAKLASSKYTQLTPIWRLFKTERSMEPGKQCTEYQVSLRLPIISPLKDTIYGDHAPNINIAKRSAALKMCIKLHEIGELSDNLLPHETSAIPNNVEYLFTNWETEDNSETGILGTNKKKRAHKLEFPSALYGAYPLPSKPVYLHLLHAKPIYSAPHYDNRYLVFYNLLCDKAGFGILSSKRMPSIPSFPIFMNLGELQVDVKVNYAIMNLSASEISSIKVFHNLIFSRVVPVIKSFMIFDNYNRDNCFLIVPVNEKWEINWETIRQHQQIEHVPPPVPFHFEPNNYHELSLVMPTYRGAAEVYVVTQVCEDLTPNSCFPTDNFYSYAHYYKRKHGLTINHLSQPMLEAKMISKRINCIKPRSMHSESKYRKRMETNDDLKEHLIPELCTIIQFPALYWLKATILPSVLHRISQLSIAEDLRHVIANEAKLGLISNDDYWPPLVIKEEEIGELNDSIIKIPFDECIENSTQSEHLLDGPDVDVLNTDVYQYPWTEDQEPPDLHRKIEDIRLIDIEHHYQFMTGRCDPEPNAMTNKKSKFMKNSSVPIRDLKTLSVTNSEGPSPVQIMHALTSKHGHDAFDLERLETLGDACLKFVTTLFLYHNFPNSNEGQLTALKCKIIGNRNLYYCGKKKCIPGRIKVDEFVPFSNFIAPAYAVFRQLQPVLLDAEVSPNVLYEIQVPEKEQFSGCISEFTKNTIESKVANWKSAETQTGMEHYLGMQIVSDKTVADCVEALIGVYLTSMGIKAAIDLLKWFGILPKGAVDTDNLLFATMSENVSSERSVNHFMPWAHDIEERLGYKFQNRALLLQAFTHPSYSANTITECYERLEFLGDAVIDFLITCYIYEYCGNFNPGTLTDLRSALVNNITFACLGVKYGLHTALLSYVPQLNDAIDRFVKFQEQRNHIVNDELLWILLEEDECKMVESVDVPKALADIFESAIGAIYVDCGKNLKKVWEILYCLMHKEIDEFSKNIPKQPIRVLYETQGARPQFLNAVRVDGTDSIMVPLQVIIAGKVKVLHGFGKNKKEAKSAAAKLALKYLLRKN